MSNTHDEEIEFARTASDKAAAIQARIDDLVKALGRAELTAAYSIGYVLNTALKAEREELDEIIDELNRLAEELVENAYDIEDVSLYATLREKSTMD